jgi:hypothetical protein
MLVQVVWHTYSAEEEKTEEELVIFSLQKYYHTKNTTNY